MKRRILQSNGRLLPSSSCPQDENLSFILISYTPKRKKEREREREREREIYISVPTLSIHFVKFPCMVLKVDSSVQ
jgi:hypothetical protein